MKYLTTAIILCSIALAAPVYAQPTLDSWPPREYLVQSLLDDIPGIMDAFHPETGRFGSEPWICTDQNRIFTLAVAWSLDHPDNPYYHSDEVLRAIAAGGVALVEAQDDAGRWRFDKKDGSYWGQIHMPWTYSRWIRAYDIVGDALPEDARETWEEGLTLGFSVMAQYFPDSHVHNIPLHRAMALYIAGECFNNEDWKQRATQFVAKAVDEQDPGGFWSENFGPVVSYNFVYSEALGIYYDHAQDPIVLDALERAARFHSAILWPDGSAVSAIDERNTYSSSIRIGNPGFSYTPEGRGYLLSQMRRHAGDEMRLIAGDMAASLLMHGGEGEVVMPGEIGEEGVTILGDNDALIRRGDSLPEGRTDDWSWAFSAYATPVPDNRWIQDRHNLLDVYHADLGLVAGGGNTKLQPWWSTFTVGDPSQLSHTPGDENPDFTPEIDLVWTPEEATVSRDGDLTRLDATLVRHTPPAREVMIEQGFEDAGGELPDGWTVSYGSAEQITVSDGQAHDGDYALFISDREENESFGLRSPKMPAEPGVGYYLEGWWLGEAENNGALYIEFWNEEDRIDGGVRAFPCAGTGAWTRYDGSMEAPEGTVAMTVLAYTGQSSVADGYFDDVTLGRLVPQEPEVEVQASVEARTEGDELLLTYRAPAGREVQAHLPLMLDGSRLELATGERVMLVDDLVELSNEEVGGSFIHGDLKVTVPDGVWLRWPAMAHNPYKRDGSSGLNAARIVLVMPFDEIDEYTVRLTAIERKPFEGLVFEARDLPFEHSEGTYTKRLDNLGSQFIGNTKDGDWLRFTLPEIEPGRYEVLGDFVLAHSYGIVEVLVDGEVVGDPFDGYWSGVDDSGTVQSFGEVQLGNGPHTVTVRIIGKNPKATARIFSVKRWLLKPL